MEYTELMRKLGEESVVKEGKRTLSKKIDSFLTNTRALLKSYEIRLYRRVYKIKQPQNQFSL